MNNPTSAQDQSLRAEGTESAPPAFLASPQATEEFLRPILAQGLFTFEEEKEDLFRDLVPTMDVTPADLNDYDQATPDSPEKKAIRRFLRTHFPEALPGLSTAATVPVSKDPEQTAKPPKPSEAEEPSKD